MPAKDENCSNDELRFFGCCKNAKVSFHFTGSFGEELPDNGRREELDDVEDDRLPPTLKTLSLSWPLMLRTIKLVCFVLCVAFTA